MSLGGDTGCLDAFNPNLQPPRLNTRTPVRWGFYFGLIPLGLLLAWSLTSGVASLWALQVSQILSSSAPTGIEPDSPEDQNLRRLWGSARSLEPGNPYYDLQLGAHLERMALGGMPRSESQRSLLETSASLYRRAIQRRPTWPLGLTSLLRLQLKLGHVGPEFGVVYRRAVTLGSLEPAAQRTLVDLGLVAWPLMDLDTRSAIRKLLADAIRQQPHYVLARAVHMGRVDVLEPLLADLPRLRAQLDKLGTTSPGRP